jgi:hypothetical protein
MYICIAQYQAQRCTLQSWKKKRKKMFFHLLFFSIQFSYVSQVFLTRCHSTKRGKRQSTNYRHSYFFLLLLLFTVIKHSERNCLLLFLSRLEMERKWDKKLGNRREYLVSFHSNPIPKSPQKKMSTYQFGWWRNARRRNDCCTTTPFSVCGEKR